MDTTIITEHLKEHAVYYGGGAAVLLPIIIIFRKWSLPAIFFAVETVIYLVIMHITMAGVVRGSAWFKGETQMEAIRDRVAGPDWTTPFYAFWRKEDYLPETIFYVEIGIAVAIIFAVIRYRPLNYKRRRKSKSEQVDPKTAESIRKARKAAGRDGYKE